MAVEDAGLDINESNADRVGVWVGSGIGGLETLEQQFETFLTKRTAARQPVLCTDDDS